MIHFEENSRVGLLKTIKSELEEEESERYDRRYARGMAKYGQNTDTVSSAQPSERHQFQHLKNV